MEHLDYVSDEAQAIGAVNTIVVQSDTKLAGYNTDAAGFLRSLGEGGFQAQDTRAVVLGAGGAARAVVHALASVGTSVTILNRTQTRAESLVADLRPRFPSLSLHSLPMTPAILGREVSAASLLVNATSLGMWPKTDGTPWPEELTLPSSVTVFDLVYTPLETRLMRQARLAGARTVGGLAMLVYQGVAAWELWTGHPAPVEVMMAAAKCALGIRDTAPEVPDLKGIEDEKAGASDAAVLDRR
jgi:shikimate dehydrogenase